MPMREASTTEPRRHGEKRLRFDFGRLDINHHDWSDGKKGVTIHGPKLTLVKLETLTTSGVITLTGRRLWFYFPSGACWNFDVYLVSHDAEAAHGERKMAEPTCLRCHQPFEPWPNSRTLCPDCALGGLAASLGLDKAEKI